MANGYLLFRYSALSSIYGVCTNNFKASVFYLSLCFLSVSLFSICFCKIYLSVFNLSVWYLYIYFCNIYLSFLSNCLVAVSLPICVYSTCLSVFRRICFNISVCMPRLFFFFLPVFVFVQNGNPLDQKK